MNSPATAASVIVTPNSTVRQMVSASRLAVAFKAGPGVFDARRRNLHLQTPQDPLDSRITAPSANPRYALRIRKGQLTSTGLVRHSDADTQYVSLAVTDALREAEMQGSIGSVGDALDNALMVSTIALYKTELIDLETTRGWTGHTL